MSVINEVLNQLEQRGVNVSAKQETVRPVPAQGEQKNKLIMLMLTFALIAAAGAWIWHGRQSSQPVVTAPVKKELPAEPKISAAKPVVDAAPSVVNDAASGVAKQPDEKPLAADLQLSFELASVPSTLRTGKNKHQPHTVVQPKSTSTKRPPAGVPPKLAALPVQSPTGAIPGAAKPAAVIDNTVPIKRVSPAQQADAEFRKGVTLMQEGRVTDAMERYQAALKFDEKHDAARHALIALLLENKRGDDAERELEEGLRISPEQSKFAILLARLEVERGAVPDALATLQKYLPYAGQQADYQAFLAALLQRQDRHEEAVTHYQVALQSVPKNGIWLVGCGISLQALQRNVDARDVFKRALESKTLNPELQEFVRQRLKTL